MTHIGTPSTTNSETYFFYDSSDRNSGMEQYDSNGNGEAMYYDRDVSGNIVARYGQDVNNWAFTARGDLYYGYTGSGSSFVRNANWEIVEKTVHLAGGLLLTIKPKETLAANQKQYSANSVLGRTLLTANASGTNTSTGIGPASTFAYDPFGNMVAGSSRPANTASGSYGYGGTLQKMTEVNLALAPIQMGARVYLPTIGRFTSLDPIPGGNANNYVYVLDPINGNDYSGNFSMSLTLPVLTGIPISGTMQHTVSGSSLQGSVNRVQVTVNSSRIQSSAAKVHSVGVSLQRPGKVVASISVREKTIVYPKADPSIINRIAQAVHSDNGQKVTHLIINAAISSSVAVGVTACLVSVVCGAGVVIGGLAAVGIAGVGAHYALSNKENRQKGLLYWTGMTARSEVTGASCAIIFLSTCGRGAMMMLKAGYQ